MTSPLRIALIGDFDPQITAHAAIPRALALAAATLPGTVEPTWIATTRLHLSPELLHEMHGIWCVPGSPYASMDGALHAIRFAREHRRPFLGTCGGFQHALIEYARNVLGLATADHAESNPDATLPLIARLRCSLVEKTAPIHLRPGSDVAALYGATTIEEPFHCNFGFNPAYRTLLEGGDLQVTGTDVDGEPRVLELRDHPFFVATLFQPERSALAGVAHPLIRAFLRASAGRVGRGSGFHS